MTRRIGRSHPAYIINNIGNLPSVGFQSSQSLNVNVRGYDIFKKDEVSAFLVHTFHSGHVLPIHWQALPAGNEPRFMISGTHMNTIHFDFGTCCTVGVTRTQYTPNMSDFRDTPHITSFIKKNLRHPFI